MTGFAVCGSFCNFEITLTLLSKVKERFGDVLPIFSENARSIDTRFFKAQDFYDKVCSVAGRDGVCSIVDAEPIGPKKMLDLLIVCPCTGNTLSKLAHGITDTTVTMAVKSHSRCGGKVLVALSSNDALSGSFESLAEISKRKNMFFVPMTQDDCDGKPYSLSFVKPLLIPAAESALKGKQLEPLFM